MTDRTRTTAERKAYANGYADGAKDEAARTPAEPEGMRAKVERLPRWTHGMEAHAAGGPWVRWPDLRAALEEPTP